MIGEHLSSHICGLYPVKESSSHKGPKLLWGKKPPSTNTVRDCIISNGVYKAKHSRL
jgi:hypothetical protein